LTSIPSASRSGRTPGTPESKFHTWHELYKGDPWDDPSQELEGNAWELRKGKWNWKLFIHRLASNADDGQKKGNQDTKSIHSTSVKFTETARLMAYFIKTYQKA
jgi:hypothetical protein